MLAYNHKNQRLGIVQGATLALITLLISVTAVQAQQRDPTRPPSQQDVRGNLLNTETFALQSVHVSATDRWAIMNGTKVREGEQMGAYRVTAIALSEVHLETDGKQVIVRMYESIKRSTANTTKDQGE